MQQKEIILFWKMGIFVSPFVIVRQWICLSWSMDLQASIRVKGGSSDVEAIVEMRFLLRIEEE